MNVYNPLNIFRIIKYIKDYDIIHTHNTACQYFVPLAKLLSSAKCKLFTTEHNTFNRRREFLLFKFIDKIIYKRYYGIISISKKATENLKLFIGNKFNVETIENGINISKYACINTIEFIPAKKIITMVAGFRQQKDQDTLLQALSLLPNNYKLWLVGDGERREALINLVEELKLTERVRFLGIQSDIPQILEQSHIVVLSSHWEGLSLSSIEGMASGRPFIASDVDGLREIVGGHGILFPHQDSRSLANEIKSLCENNERYQKIAHLCQERAKQFDIDIMAKKYNQLYY